ncbi:cysteine rich with two potential transmembrane domain regions [Cryptosporidium sp. chipmunk genotype I]|uniref:cysteine rich with two potential transmembrane domain regions n=1 Tax=Cryptosporidium sp. chipmunk genotype I TaxID=1280935 RepID=UPI00351A79F4|nr:cysteine rich with two potential transmembrane domain regions [Cryptosporidium sp. chipmunk genotype I]
MGPKQRKSLSSASSQSYSNSPWKALTRIELYQVLDQCDIPVSSEKLLKGELIELLEGNLDEEECRKWLKYYEKPLPNSGFGLRKNETPASNTVKKEIIARERKSVPAYIAVANTNSDVLNSIQGSPLNEFNGSRTLRRRNSMYSAHLGDGTKESYEPKDSESANELKSNTLSDCCVTTNTKFHSRDDHLNDNMGCEMHASTNDKLEVRAHDNKFLGHRVIGKAKMALMFMNSKMIIILATLFIFFALYNHYYYFFHEPNFCNSNLLSEKTLNFANCIKCPPNGHCKDGKLKCSTQYKKAIKYLNNKWQIVCIYDNEAFDLAEEMLTFITNKLRKLRGNRACGGNHLHDIFFPDKRKNSKILDFDRSIVLSEKEINDIIHLSFNYIEQSTVESALSIMWNSIKTGNSLTRYGLKLVERKNPELNSDLGAKDNDSQSSEEGSFIEALDSETSVICEFKLFIQKWLVILTGIIAALLPLYFKIRRIRRKTEISRKIKAIIFRENRKDTKTGLFVGPDSETILRLLRVELPKYKKILNEQLVIEYCDELEQNDPNIHKTLMSESRHPFYWSSG